MRAELSAERALPLAQILRWLGPWTKDSAAPAGVRVEHWVLRPGRLHGLRAFQAGVRHDAPGPGVVDTYVYSPGRSAGRGPVGIYVISPGLHFAGADDPRFDRFCRVLAGSGFVVVAPFVPDFVDLRVWPSAVDDLELIVRRAYERYSAELGRPVLFSISFGSWLALEVAARLPDLVDGVVTFGGYADFGSVCRFSVDGIMRGELGPVSLPNDPMNSPALFLNLLRFLDVDGETYELERALSMMCHRTWGRMELKEAGRLSPFVSELLPEVPAHQRDLFRVACGEAPGASRLVEEALARGGSALHYASPRWALGRLECPVVICHARDDDVIPYGEALELERALRDRVPTRLYLTGLYGHSGQGTVSARGLRGEVSSLLGIARTLASGGRLREALEAER